MADEKKPKKVKVKKVPKLSKVGIFKTILGAIPKALKSRKSKILKQKEEATKFVKEQKETAKGLQTQAAKTYDDLSPAHKKIWHAGEGQGWSKKKILAYIAGGGTLLGLGTKLTLDVKKEMERAKGGYVRKMKRGGSVRRMNAGGAVNSRAIAKKYFKGGMV